MNAAERDLERALAQLGKARRKVHLAEAHRDIALSEFQRAVDAVQRAQAKANRS
jgi:transcription initiation factor TFIIIB Brf1 subunit/transcription initiation factor TFIIB